MSQYPFFVRSTSPQSDYLTLSSKDKKKFSDNTKAIKQVGFYDNNTVELDGGLILKGKFEKKGSLQPELFPSNPPLYFTTGTPESKKKINFPQISQSYDLTDEDILKLSQIRLYEDMSTDEITEAVKESIDEQPILSQGGKKSLKRKQKRKPKKTHKKTHKKKRILNPYF